VITVTSPVENALYCDRVLSQKFNQRGFVVSSELFLSQRRKNFITASQVVLMTLLANAALALAANVIIRLQY
jgi:hypothetical protein